MSTSEEQAAQLEETIVKLEGQRVTLGDAVVDTALEALRRQLFDLRQSASMAPAPSLNGERKLVTVMFADLSGFTALSERMDPESSRNLINTCFARLVPIVEKYQGTVEKFIGDEIMAMFGAPVVHENDAERAVRAALEMMAELILFNVEQGTDLGIHIGINTGLTVAGGIGSPERQAYGVSGDAVNLASRLADASERGQIFIGPDTHRLVCSLFEVKALPSITIKGKRKPIQAYQVIGLKAKAGSVRGLERQGLASPLVGRDAEMALFKGSIDRLLEGRGSIVAITGEAGLGKSRLVAEIHQIAGTTYKSGLQWLEGQTLSFGQTISYWPFQEILRTWAGITKDDDEHEAWNKLECHTRAIFAEETMDFLPFLASLSALEVKGGCAERVRHLDGEAMGKQIFLTSRRFFERLARVQPLVLIFEDLQWMDESSANLLEHLLPLVDGVPLLIVGLGRPERGTPITRFQESAVRNHDKQYTEISLIPLSPAESGQLVRNLLEIEDLPARMRKIIVANAEGNPFFLEEIIRSLLDSGAIARDPASGRWQTTPQIEGFTIPDTVQGVIMARVDRLDKEVKHVLQVAAVIGRNFLYRVLRAIAEAEQKLDEHLAQLQQLELIRERQVAPELEYMFKHALAQEATYESILLQKRRELHARVAQAIESLFADRLEAFYGLLAYHYAKAESWEKAQAYLLKAGDQAGGMAADAEALQHYQKAMTACTSVLSDQWDSVQRAALERKMGEALFRRGENAQAFDCFQRALRDLGDPLPISRWTVRLNLLREIVWQIGHRLLPLSLRRRPSAPADEATAEKGRIYESMYWISVVNPEHIILIILRALNFSERHDFVPGVMMGFAILQVLADFMGLHRLADYYSHKAGSLAEQSGHPGAQGTVNAMRAIHENVQGRWTASIEFAQRAVEVQRQSGHWNPRGWTVAFISLADAHIHLGQFAQALSYGQDLARFGEDSADRQAQCWGLSRRGFARRGLGQLETSITDLIKAMELAKSVPDYQTYVDAGGELGQCYLRQGELPPAFAVFEDCRRTSIEGNLMKSPVTTRFRNGLAEAYLLSAEQAGVIERTDWLKKAGRACQDALRQGKAYLPGMPEAMMLQGRYEWLRARHGAAKKCWRRSLALAEALEVHYDLGRTHLEMGWRLGERVHLESAEVIFAAAGAEWDRARARDLLH